MAAREQSTMKGISKNMGQKFTSKFAVSVLVLGYNIKMSDSVLIVYLLRAITETQIPLKIAFRIDNFAVRYLV